MISKKGEGLAAIAIEIKNKAKPRGRRIRTLSTKVTIVSAEPLSKRYKKTKKNADAPPSDPARARSFSQRSSVVLRLTELPYCAQLRATDIVLLPGRVEGFLLWLWWSLAVFFHKR